MTIGIRDTRKIDAALQHHGRRRARAGPLRGFDRDLPEFIDGYGMLILPTTGRYFQMPYRSLVPQGVGT